MIRQSSAVLNRIAAIRKLKMVNAYRLFDGDSPLHGILAYYGDETINLCSADEHFPELFDKLAKQYELEAPKSMIVTDEYTRELLVRSKGLSPQGYEARLSAFTELSAPDFLPRAFSHHYILPIVRFILERLHGEKEDALRFEETGRDWFGQGVLCGVSHGRTIRFPYQILWKHGQLYEVRLANALKPGDLMCVEIAFETERILLSFKEDAYLYTGDLSLYLTEDTPVLRGSFREGKKELVRYEKECERREDACPPGRAAALTAGEGADWTAFAFPWGDWFYRASGEKENCLVLCTEREDCRISRAFTFRKVTEEEPAVLFGTLSFLLYEKDKLSELHLLDMSYPRSSEYFKNYVGKIYGCKA